MPVSWTSQTSKGEETKLIGAITLSSETIIAKLLIPNWMLKLPFQMCVQPCWIVIIVNEILTSGHRFRKVDSAWNDLEDFVKSHTRRISQEIREQGNSDQFDVRNADLLHRPIASSEGDGKYKLS